MPKWQSRVFGSLAQVKVRLDDLLVGQARPHTVDANVGAEGDSHREAVVTLLVLDAADAARASTGSATRPHMCSAGLVCCAHAQLTPGRVGSP
jgi:hypothetical protein